MKLKDIKTYDEMYDQVGHEPYIYIYNSILQRFNIQSQYFHQVWENIEHILVGTVGINIRNYYLH